MERERTISYQIATNPDEFEAGRKLFREYADSLNVDLSFQDFSNELETVEKQYSKPDGVLFLACDGNVFVGCSGVRKLDEETAELKRMYVKDEYKGRHIGFSLLQHYIEFAKGSVYKKIRLDTLKDMTNARQLYKSFGFYTIPSYRFNPYPGTTYMEMEL